METYLKKGSFFFNFTYMCFILARNSPCHYLQTYLPLRSVKVAKRLETSPDLCSVKCEVLFSRPNQKIMVLGGLSVFPSFCSCGDVLSRSFLVFKALLLVLNTYIHLEHWEAYIKDELGNLFSPPQTKLFS